MSKTKPTPPPKSPPSSSGVNLNKKTFTASDVAKVQSANSKLY